MPRHLVTALLALALLAGGCGSKDPEPSEGGAPAVTSGQAFELGGADGSGADGEEKDSPRGGIAAGPDTREPGDTEYGDSRQAPPRNLGDDAR